MTLGGLPIILLSKMFDDLFHEVDLQHDKWKISHIQNTYNHSGGVGVW